GTSNHQAGEQKDEGCGKQAIATEGMEPERLDEKQPEGHAEHRNHGPGEKLSSAAITEGGKRREAKSAEISEPTQTAHGDRADFCIAAAQNLKAVGGSTTNSRFAGQVHHGELSRLDQTEQRNQTARGVEKGLHP